MLRKYILEFVVFICGATVMIFELVGSRILAPYLGTSTFVWTSIIGVILGSLSIGYWWGGRIADKNPNAVSFSNLIFLSAIFIGIITFVQENILIEISKYVKDLRLGALLAAFSLFTIPSILLGMISPYAVKLKMSSIEKTGSTVGNIYAISTLGSIVGTFLAGYILIPAIGTIKIVILLSIILILLSLIVNYQKNVVIRGIILFALIIVLYLTGIKQIKQIAHNFIDLDTEYSRVWIYNGYENETNKPMKCLMISNEYSSAMYLNSDELCFEYTKYYNIGEYFAPKIEKSLIIGGAGYSYPKEFLKRYKNAKLDVVEIDPKITEIAKKYFNLKEDNRLAIYHEDGRTYLNNNKKKYDSVYIDAFRSCSLPYQLTTKEAVKKVYDALESNGVALVNVISSIDGIKGKFLRAEYSTYKSIFPKVILYPVSYPDNGELVQNIIIVALKSQKDIISKPTNKEIESYIGHIWKKEVSNDIGILTDDYAPVDYYVAAAINK